MYFHIDIYAILTENNDSTNLLRKQSIETYSIICKVRRTIAMHNFQRFNYNYVKMSYRKRALRE